MHYQIELFAPQQHRLKVSAVLDFSDENQVFRLPNWLRGSYMIRDFAKHVSHLQAEVDGKASKIIRLDKSSFKVICGAGCKIRLDYQVYAYDLSVRKAYFDDKRAFWNHSSLCYCPVGLDMQPMVLEILPPQGALGAGWQVATTLEPLHVDLQGFGRYQARHFEDLIDQPVEVAPFQRFDFAVNHIPHALVLSGRVAADGARICEDLRKVCEVQRDFFGQEPKLKQYLFLTNVVGSGYGGLEHLSSTALIASRSSFPAVGETGLSKALTKEYRQFLGLCSHEYFHLWNVKRITAQSFQDSDLQHEAYSQDLWHYEGITSYYDDLLLLRAGVIGVADYLELLSESATRLERMPGRHVQTLAEASFEAWTKYYQPDEDSPNSGVSYYIKGAWVALLLDLRLRQDHQSSLDAVMQLAWQRYGRLGVALPEGGLEALAQELAGQGLGGFFVLSLRSTAELPIAEALESVGIVSEKRQGAAPVVFKPQSTVVAQVLAGSSAYAAGLSGQDCIVAVDGLKATASNVAGLFQQIKQPVTVHYFRQDELRECTVAADTTAREWRFSLHPQPSEDVLARRRAWLGI
jgi:predicted metalloprotease with PDZ domain